MNDLPEITAVISTYFPGADYAKRIDALEETLASWNMCLDYAGKIGFHVADDGSPPMLMTVEDRIRLAFEHNPIFSGTITNSRQERQGVGASLNAGLDAAFERSPLAFHAVDDWALDGPMDLTPWAETLLDAAFNIGMIRLGPPHPGITGEVFMCRGGWMLRLNPHNFAFATRPFLMNRHFWRHYGRFKVGLSALETERLYNDHYCRLKFQGIGPGIALALPHPWRHVESVELSSVSPVMP